MTENKKQQKQGNSYRPNVWSMIRDISIASLDKKQVPLVSFGAIIILSIVKMPQEDVSKFAFEIIHLLKALHLTGWGLAVLLLAGWHISINYLKTIHQQEIARIAKEKKQLQQQLINKK